MLDAPHKQSFRRTIAPDYPLELLIVIRGQQHKPIRQTFRNRKVRLPGIERSEMQHVKIFIRPTECPYLEFQGQLIGVFF